jgi:K+-sensing histidine kinase KdpD
VADTGVGITPELCERIFDPFFTTKDRAHGTGLGLAIAYGIIDNAGGRITVASTPGAGTTFTVTLPVTQEPIDAGSADAAPPTPPTPRQLGPILVVDDDAAVLAST